MKGTVTRFGDTLAITIPREVLSRLGLKEGDSVSFHHTKTGIELVPTDSEFTKQTDIAKDVISKNRNVLRKLEEDR